MAESLTEMAKDLTMALIEKDLIASTDTNQYLHQIHASLRELKAQEDRTLASGESREGETTERARAIDWKKSIRKYVVDWVFLMMILASIHAAFPRLPYESACNSSGSKSTNRQ
jgi:predicted transcriptional regulator